MKLWLFLPFVLVVTHQKSCRNTYTAAFISIPPGLDGTSKMVGVTYRRSDLPSRRDAATNPQDSNDNARELDLCSTQTPPKLLRDLPPINRRRELLLRQTPQISSLILASLILGESAVNAQEVTEPVIKSKTIVITGANSGIGFEACKRLMTKGHTIILACRSMDKAQEAIYRIQQDTTISSFRGTLIPAECDLADMSSIQNFVTKLPTHTKIDTLCLNAGVARNTAATDCARTKDGLELTGMMMMMLLLTVAAFIEWESISFISNLLRFAYLCFKVGVNHFGHFYLNHLMLPLLANDGRIVVTASSVHDPESPGGAQGLPATLGALNGLQQFGKDCEMIGE